MNSKIIAVDTETTGLDIHSPSVVVTHVSWFDSSGKGDVIEVANHEEQLKLTDLANRLNRNDTTLLLFNAKFDLPMLSKLGIRPSCNIVDVLFVSQLVKPDELRHNLKHLVRKYLKDPYLEEIAIKKWIRQNPGKVHGHAPRHIVTPYALADARRTLELFYYLSTGLDKYRLWTVLEREMLLLRYVIRLEAAGVYIDKSRVCSLLVESTNELKLLKDAIVLKTGRADFNPNSNKQVIAAVYDGSVMPTSFSHKTGQPKVNEVSLLESPSVIGSLVVKYRKLNKARTTYLAHLKDVHSDGRLRVNFNQNAARTGRFSSSSPNLQNIPRSNKDSVLGKIRSCFVAEKKDNRLVFIDYSQIELRLTAHFSDERRMLESINKGIDLHSTTCKLLFDKNESMPDWERYRYIAKKLNFAVIYGTGPNTFRLSVLHETSGALRISLQEAAMYISQYKHSYPNIDKLLSSVIDEVAKTGGVTNYFMRYMPVDRYAPYKGVNYKIQSTAADFMKMRMIMVARWLTDNKLKTRLIMTIHDELVFEMPNDEKHILPHLIKIMEDRETFKVPLTCSASFGMDWQNKKPIKVEAIQEQHGKS